MCNMDPAGKQPPQPPVQAQNSSIITTLTQAHNQVVAAVVTNLNQAGHPVQTAQVAPVTAETPIAPTPELKSIGAEIINTDDIADVAEKTVKELTVGTTYTRFAKPGKFLNIFLDKLRRKKKPEEQIVEETKT